MKIAVYAISKNEEQFVKRFCESAKDADLILIADTGSTDNTVIEARKLDATVYNICISPWRFDKARDAALALIPSDYDVCISLDLDEVLEDGWREEIERIWVEGATRMQYLFDWSNGIRFYSDKIHSRHGYFWKHPCHETLTAEHRTVEKWVRTDKLLISHYPDETKSRGQYMPLLEVAANEDKECPRNAFYYARELVFTRQYDKAIPALINYLEMPKASWEHERSYAMRLLGEAVDKSRNGNPLYWYRRAVAENPTAREPWHALAKYCYENKHWDECYYACKMGLSITNQEFVYTMNPNAWGYELHDLLAISAYNLGDKTEAIRHGEIALSFDPDNTRLSNNLKYYRDEHGTNNT